MLRLRFHFLLPSAAVVILVGIGMITNVPIGVTAEDEKVFEEIFGLKPTISGSALPYEDQLDLIRRAQQVVFERIPIGLAIPERASREPADLLRHGSGVCYDHARTFDKLYQWLGFEARHLYILFPVNRRTGESLPKLLGLLHRWTTSHAATEVKTHKGWMIVDSVQPWIALTPNGTPLRAEQLQAHRNQLTGAPDAYLRDFLALRGVYSRQGQLYPPRIPFPDLNWLEFIQGLVE
jgi:hypothetical protein